MPASKNPGPQDQKADKRKKWPTQRLRLLGNIRPQNRPLAPRVLEPIGPWPPQPTGQITENSGAALAKRGAATLERRSSMAADHRRPLHRKRTTHGGTLRMEARMHDLSFVMQRIAAGDRARFFHAYFGQQEVELSRGWIFKRKTRVSCIQRRSRKLKTCCTRAVKARPVHGPRSNEPRSVSRSGTQNARTGPTLVWCWLTL